MAIYPQLLTIYLYSAHRAVIFAIAQLSCCYTYQNKKRLEKGLIAQYSVCFWPGRNIINKFSRHIAAGLVYRESSRRYNLRYSMATTLRRWYTCTWWVLTGSVWVVAAAAAMRAAVESCILSSCRTMLRCLSSSRLTAVGVVACSVLVYTMSCAVLYRLINWITVEIRRNHLVAVGLVFIAL